MSLNTAAQVVISNAITGLFMSGVESYEPIYTNFCSVVPSKRRKEQYAHLGAMPGVHEWIGERNYAKLRAAEFEIINRDWTDGLEIERNDLDDDYLGMYGEPLKAMGVEAMAHPDELLFELIEAGASKECFDGQNFYDTDHSWGDSGTQSNKLTSPIAADGVPTEAEFRTAFHAAFTAMRLFKRDNGKFFMRPTLKPIDGLVLLVHPDVEEVATKAIGKELVNGGETNVVLAKPKILPIPHLTSAMTFHLINTKSLLKPFVFQARQPLKTEVIGKDSIEKKVIQFHTHARYNMGYGAWWNAVQQTLTYSG